MKKAVILSNHVTSPETGSSTTDIIDSPDTESIEPPDASTAPDTGESAEFPENPDTGVRTPIEQQTFTDLGVMPDLVRALEDVGIIHPFPIQSMAIPIAIMGTDMIGQARTGTGKTLAFGLTLLQRIVVPTDRDFEVLAAPGKPQALVVAPTRELARQVSADISTASTHRKARVLTVYGGVGYDPQLDALAAGVEVVVGTPGRLLDLADRGALDLSHVKVMVLDEADEMLDLGFLPDVERLLAKTPELRQTMLFSATMPSAIVSLARKHLRHPVNIRAESQGEEQTVPTTAQFVYQAHSMDKLEVIARILQAEGRNRCMIFSRTKRAAQRVADDLADRGFAAAPIHGDLNQAAREKALKRFRDGSVDVLVATDVAARGIDVSGVTHVMNYECPDDDKTYVHRIGRTGRAGATGVAITFVDWADLTRWKVINKALDLPFHQPQETYSTSEHLYHDLGIPHGVKGRVGAAADRAPAPRRNDRDSGGGDKRSSGRNGEDRPRRDRDSGGGDKRSSGRTGEDQPRRDRDRRRTRNGVAVGADAEATPTEATAPATTDVAADDAPKRKRRRRRRSRSTDNGASDNGASDNGASDNGASATTESRSES